MMQAIYQFIGTVLPIEALQFTFMKNAFLAILLLTPLLGLLGTMAVNQQMAFFSDALGHSALTGIGLGIILGVSNDLVSMLVFGILWALLICVIKRTGSASTDTIISVFSSTSVAAGLLILSRGGGFAKYSSLLIGDVLAVTSSDLLWLLLALIGGAAIYALLLPYCDKLYITRFYKTKKADRFLPDLDKSSDWHLQKRSTLHEQDGLYYTFDLYTKEGSTKCQ